MTKPMPMLKTLFSACLSITTGFGVPELHGASAVRRGNVVIPESSQVRTEDLGLRAHSNHVILAPEVTPNTPDAIQAPPGDGTPRSAAVPPAGQDCGRASSFAYQLIHPESPI